MLLTSGLIVPQMIRPLLKYEHNDLLSSGCLPTEILFYWYHDERFYVKVRHSRASARNMRTVRLVALEMAPKLRIVTVLMQAHLDM